MNAVGHLCSIYEYIAANSPTYGKRMVDRQHDNLLVMVPYEIRGNEIIPVTVHATDKKQITARLRSGRFRNV